MKLPTPKSERVQILVFALILTGLMGYGVVQAYPESAWFAPAGAPPTHNVAAPINVSNNPQTKYGNLTINASLAVATTASANGIVAWSEVRAPKYCDLNGQNCLTTGSSTNERHDLYMGFHTEEQCEYLGGAVVIVETDKKICKFTRDAKPGSTVTGSETAYLDLGVGLGIGTDTTTERSDLMSCPFGFNEFKNYASYVDIGCSIYGTQWTYDNGSSHTSCNLSVIPGFGRQDQPMNETKGDWNVHSGDYYRCRWKESFNGGYSLHNRACYAFKTEVGCF